MLKKTPPSSHSNSAVQARRRRVKGWYDKRTGEKAYNYEVTKIELIDAPFTGVDDSSNQMAMTTTNSISVAKLLKDVEKSYDKGKKLLDESNSTEEEAVFYRDGETDSLWKDGNIGLSERTTLAKLTLSNNHKQDKVKRNDALRVISDNLSQLRRAMGLQRQFDKSTAKRVADLARILISSGHLSGMSEQEVKRLGQSSEDFIPSGGLRLQGWITRKITKAW